jgi:hypothetical protein
MLDQAMRHEPHAPAAWRRNVKAPPRECRESDPRKNESRQGRHIFRTAEERRNI